MLDTETIARVGHDEGDEDGGTPTSEPEKYRFLLQSLGHIANGPQEDPDYLVKHLVPASGLHVVYGPPGVGKSFLVLDMALHVAAGMAWAGKKVRGERSCVVYVAAEGARAFKRRIVTALEQRGIPRDVPFLLVDEAPQLGQFDGDFGFATFMANLKDQCKKLKMRPSLIVLDTLSRSMIGLDESSSKDMGVFVGKALRLSKTFDDALIMPVHHTGKEVDRGARGSSALHGAADAMWLVRKGEDGLGFLVEKMKDGPSGHLVRFDLRVVPCGVDRDGETVTTQVVAFGDDPVRVAPAIAEKPTRDPVRVATQRLIGMIVSEIGSTVAQGAPAATGGGKAVESKVLSKEAIRRMVESGSHGTADSARNVLGRHRDALKLAGVLVEADGWTWLAADVGKTPDPGVGRAAEPEAAPGSVANPTDATGGADGGRPNGTAKGVTLRDEPSTRTGRGAASVGREPDEPSTPFLPTAQRGRARRRGSDGAPPS